jgi:hypothetical protein
MPRQTRSSKKARQVKPIRLYDLNVHIRLHIYGFLGGHSSIGEPDLVRLDDNSDVMHDYWNDMWETYKEDKEPTGPYVAETTVAASLGDLEVLQYLQDIPTNKWIVANCDTDSEVFDFLSFVNTLLLWYKHFKAFRWADTMLFPMDEWVFDASIVRGLDLDVLKWLRKKDYPWSAHTFPLAVGLRNMDVLKWLHLEDCPWSKETFEYAIDSHRDFNVLVWLRIQGCPWDEWSLIRALSRDDEDRILILQWLLREQCPCTEYVLSNVIMWYNIFSLQVLVDAKCKFLPHHLHLAIKYNQDLDVLNLLRQAECPMDCDTFCCAVKRGDMEILRWLKDQGCPWNSSVFTAAVEKGNREIIRWLFDEGCPTNRNTLKAVLEKYVLNDTTSSA